MKSFFINDVIANKCRMSISYTIGIELDIEETHLMDNNVLWFFDLILGINRIGIVIEINKLTQYLVFFILSQNDVS